MIRLLCLALLIISCFGCTRKYHLVVRTDYVTRKTLASYKVNTPDPRLNHPPLGQRLIVTWNFPPEYFDYEDLRLHTCIRLGDYSEITEEYPICRSSRPYVFSLMNDDYFSKGGIRTYKIEVIGDGRVLETWNHHLWFELISIDINN